MKCTFTKLDDGHWFCSRCNYTSKSTPEKPPLKECIPGLGDHVQKVLKKVGIADTIKSIITKGKELLGYKDTSCGCGQRQEALNEIGKNIGL